MARSGFILTLGRATGHDTGEMRWFAVSLALLAVAISRGASATNPMVEFPPHPETLPALRYAQLTRARCLEELDARGISYGKAPPVPTIDAPLRLVGPLRGVAFEFWHPTAKKTKEGPILDCRLLLGLDDLAGIAAAHDIARIRFNSIYRGNWSKKGQRHPAGVAIDVVELVKTDGEVLNVLADYHGAGVRSRTCGDGAPAATGAKAVFLREFVCAVHASRTFNLILTPHYDRAHENHFHLEVRRGIKWWLTQ